MHSILIVDDETSFLNILKIILGRAGYQVLTAMDGLEGLEKVRAHRPDLVVLDDMLPGLSGGDICQKIKRDPALAHTPVIFYSAGQRARDREFIRQIGADMTLMKPFKPTEIIQVVQKFLAAPQ